MTYIAPVLGVLAGLVGIADTIPYVRDTVRGLIRPHRGTHRRFYVCQAAAGPPMSEW